jgi:hypothetical protein
MERQLQEYLNDPSNANAAQLRDVIKNVLGAQLPRFNGHGEKLQPTIVSILEQRLEQANYDQIDSDAAIKNLNKVACVPKQNSGFFSANSSPEKGSVEEIVHNTLKKFIEQKSTEVQQASIQEIKTLQAIG